MQSILFHSNDLTDPEEPTIRGSEGWEVVKTDRKMGRGRNFVRENWEKTSWKREGSEKRQEEERKRGRAEFWREIMGIRRYFGKKIEFMKRDTRKEEVFWVFFKNL